MIKKLCLILLCVTGVIKADCGPSASIDDATCHSFRATSPYDGWAERTFASMTLDEKIGQLFIVTAISDPDLLNPNWKQFYQDAVDLARLKCEWYEYGSVDLITELINDYHIGGIIFLGWGRFESQRDVTSYYREISKYPLFIAQDFEAGLGGRLTDGMKFPHAMTLGAVQNNTLLYDMGKIIAQQSKAVGVDINFAPVVDVNINYKNPVIHMRSFGQDKELVFNKAAAYMNGMQDEGLIACAKHFPGHGDTEVDSHYDLPRITKTLDELYATELYPFKKMIDAGVASIMTAHLEVPALESEKQVPTSLSYATVTKLLREKLGFNGLVITDALVMKGVTKHHEPGDIELKALRAGSDILLCPTSVPLAFAAIKKALNDGGLTEENLNEHVMRILRAKEKSLKQGYLAVGEREIIVTGEAISLRDQLYAEAITVCPSIPEDKVLPLIAEKGKVCVIHLGDQPITTFEDSIREHHDVIAYDSEVENDDDVRKFVDELSACENFIIAINGMSTRDLRVYGINEADLYLVELLRRHNKKLVVVLFGSPYALRLFSKRDTVIMAYEDTDASQRAAAEIICGIRTANGVLPVSDLRK